MTERIQGEVDLLRRQVWLQEQADRVGARRVPAFSSGMTDTAIRRAGMDGDRSRERREAQRRQALVSVP